MKENLLAFTEVAPKWLLTGLSFLLPLFFLTTNFDYFEYPKQVLIWVSALLLLGLWLLRFALTGKAKLSKTPLDLPWIILLVVVGVSAYLAAYKYPAIMGAIGRTHPSLVSMVAYFLIFYIGVNTLTTFKDIKNILMGFVVGVSVLSLVSLLHFLGTFGFLYEQTKLAFFLPLSNTNPAASPTSAAVTLALSIPMVLGWISYSHKNRADTNREFTASEILLTLSLILMGSVVVIYNSIPAWIALIVGLLIFAFWNRVSTLRGIGTYVSVTVVVLTVVALLVHLPFFKNNIPLLKNQPSREIQLGFRDSWVVSIHTVRDRPFFGSGFGSFSSDFTRYRQVGFNLDPNWNLRFNTSFNEYFNILSMIGIVGFLAWLFLIFRFIQFAWMKALKKVDIHEHALIVGLTASVLAFFVSMLFTASTSTIFFTFILASLLCVALVKIAGAGLEQYNLSSRYQDVVSPSAQPLVVAIPGFILIALAFFFGGKTVLANYHYRQAQNEAQAQRAQGVLVNLTRAIRLDPQVDLYHSEMARSSFVIATALARRENRTDQDNQNIQALARQAIEQATVATQIDPVNVSNWETLSSIYRSVSGTNQQTLQASLQSLVQAINLDPANPQLRLAIGGIFYAAGQYEQATLIFDQAVQLKGDFANARYNLANSLVKQERYNQAFTQYEEIKKLVPPGSADYDRAQSEQDAIKDKVTTQGNTTPANNQNNEATSSAQP
jgi:O-antigen ligase